MMTEQEIIDKSEWLHNSYVLRIESELFGKLIPIEISFDKGEERTLSETSVEAINNFLNLDTMDLDQINQLIWEHCLKCNQSQVSKGSTDGGKTWFDTSTSLEENLSKWNITNKDDALKKSTIQGVWISNTWGKNANGNIFYLGISVDWDSEHGMNIIYRNGKIDDVE